MKAVDERACSPETEGASASPPASRCDHSTSIPPGPIQYRFVLQFAAQMSTPCSRGLGIKPRAGRVLVRRAPRLFQSHLQRHSVLQ
jgi:hypothetical protein